ncbi:hypothetical protein [Corynebacterium pacaense]|uniref:hypothetical protein n=1 Tax=Corynebacterium pacaense TaxID=1816684 RepID=UPI0011779367|nr:hypothetical protein [Corynebacterium pacaense]
MTRNTDRPSSLDLDARAAQVLTAALDGHNPRIAHNPDGSVSLRPSNNPSDLDVAICELLAVPVADHYQIKALAQQVIGVIQWISARHNIDQGELLETFRRNGYGHILAAEQTKESRDDA